MSDQDLLPADPQAETTTPETPNQAPDLLSQIKKPDGSQYYQDGASLVAGFQAKENHIQTLETENAQYRTKLDALTEQMAALQAQLDNVSNVSELVDQVKNKQQETVTVDKVVQQTLQELQNSQEQARIQQNEQLFQQEVLKAFGEDTAQAQAHIAKTMAAENMSREEVQFLIRSNPALAMKTLAISAKEPASTPAAPAAVNPVGSVGQGVTPQMNTVQDMQNALLERMKNIR